MKDFNAFLDLRRYKNWAHKIASWKYLSEDLFCQSSSPPPSCPEHKVPHFGSPPWTPFRRCWKSAPIAARDLILVEADGKCQFVAGKWQTHGQEIWEILMKPSRRGETGKNEWSSVMMVKQRREWRQKNLRMMQSWSILGLIWAQLTGIVFGNMQCWRQHRVHQQK